MELTENREGTLVAAQVAAARDEHRNDEARCAWACQRYLGGVARDDGEVTACEATGVGDYVDAPWDPANMEVTIECTIVSEEPGFCTGRRPLGHREVGGADGSRGAWLAAHAHLERASVVAFRELAQWLAGQGAPPGLVDRCRAAADDEVEHANAIAALAAREGAEVPPCTSDPAPDDLFAVALHNAVEGCVSEAFGALVAAYQAGHAGDPRLRELLRTIAGDELRHAQLAWDLHAWLWPQLTAPQQDRLAAAQALALAQLPARALAGALAAPSGFGWPTPGQAAALAERFARRIIVDAALPAAA